MCASVRVCVCVCVYEYRRVGGLCNKLVMCEVMFDVMGFMQQVCACACVCV